MGMQPVHVCEVLQSLLGAAISESTEISHPEWVKCDGILGAHFIISFAGLHPVFGRVINVLIILDNEVCHMNFDYFDDHFHAYAVSHTSDKSFISVHQLKYPFVLHSHKRNDVIFIYLKCYFQC